MGGDSGTVISGAFCPPILLRAESVVLLVPLVDDGVPLARLLGVPEDVRLLLLLEIGEEDLGELAELARMSVLLLLSGDSTLTTAPNPSNCSLPKLNSDLSGLVLGSIEFSTAPSSSATMSITLFFPNM